MSTGPGRLLRVETPESVVVTYPLAGVGSRGVAAVVDAGLILLLLLAEAAVAALVLLGASRLFGIGWQGRFASWVIAAFIAAAFVTYWGYYIFGEVFRNGRTTGKRVAGIRVVREDGSRVGVLDSVIRNVVRIIDLMPAVYSVAIVSVFFSPKAQRLGDMAAGTVVIAESGEPGDLVLGPAEERAALAADFLARREELTPEARWQVAVELLALWDERPQAGWDEPVVAGRVMDLAGLR